MLLASLLLPDPLLLLLLLLLLLPFLPQTPNLLQLLFQLPVKAAAGFQQEQQHRYAP
jgi:hypothetical protein